MVEPQGLAPEEVVVFPVFQGHSEEEEGQHHLRSTAAELAVVELAEADLLRRFQPEELAMVELH